MEEIALEWEGEPLERAAEECLRGSHAGSAGFGNAKGEDVLAYKPESGAVKSMALLSVFRDPRAKGDAIELAGRVLRCGAFEGLGRAGLKAAVAYVLTIGRGKARAGCGARCRDEGGLGAVNHRDRTLAEMFYGNIWENIFLQATFEMMIGHVKKIDGLRGLFVSDSFGPGYYGMETGAARSITATMDTSKIGVSVNASGMLSPAASRVGVVLLSEKDVFHRLDPCVSCEGKKDGCAYCGKMICRDVP